MCRMVRSGHVRTLANACLAAICVRRRNGRRTRALKASVKVQPGAINAGARCLFSHVTI